MHKQLGHAWQVNSTRANLGFFLGGRGQIWPMGSDFADLNNFSSNGAESRDYNKLSSSLIVVSHGLYFFFVAFNQRYN